MWTVWASLFLAGQFAPFVALHLPEDIHTLIYLTSHDISLVAISLFTYVLVPWQQMVGKMVAFSFVGWSITCMIGNGVVEIFAFADPAYIAAIWLFIAFVIAWSCLRFIVISPPFSDHVQSGRLYLVVSKPHNIWGAMGLILTGTGGHFAVWDPEKSALFEYQHGELIFCDQEKTLLDKAVLDFGPATTARRKALDDLVGTAWTPLKNCMSTLTNL